MPEPTDRPLGQRVAMTEVGRAVARERRWMPRDGIVVDVFHAGRRSEQWYVRPDTGGGALWWPRRCWRAL